MTVLWLNLLLVYIFALYARAFAKPVNLGPNLIRPHWIPACLAAITLIFVSGLRKTIGDTFFYMYSYSNTVFDWKTIQAQKDIGFGILQMVLQKFSRDPQLLIFTVALITYALIVFVFYQYSRLFELSLYVFITSGLFTVSMNGIRQFLAAAIVFAGTKFIFNGNWKAYLSIVIFAAQFHSSAYVLIPIYFIVRRPAWSRTTFLLLAIAILIVVGFNQFSSTLFSALDNTQYAEYQNVSYQGSNINRVFVYAVPIILAYLGRHKLREICPYGDYIVNMSFLALIFMIISTQNWIFARFTIYFGLYTTLLLSWVVKLFIEKNQRLIYYGVIFCYVIYFYYESVISLNLIYRSNYIPLWL